MDRTQQFIKECLFTKNFEDPNKPISDNRLQETLLILPTDGGVHQSLRRNKSKLKVTIGTVAEADAAAASSIKHPNYRKITKNARVALKDYINRCKSSVRNAKRIAREQNITEKNTLMDYLKVNHPKVWEDLPNFDKFKPMHEQLWIGYIKEMLNIPVEVRDTSKFNINRSQALFKLSMADYNGSFLKIVKSVNKNMIGIEGIVIWDSQKNFIMMTEGALVDEIKCIPKKGTIFALEIPLNDEDALQFSILGDRFKYRSSDRAGRKFKARRVDDMLYYADPSF
ncbi:ZYRO0B08954p [Zygosaccharomyces rouxii]|uniref:Ribonuclease P protein subunit n=1 Tax=Zygosaccharomyces rouxii (strain ATCC 2623 / CBS 732 / NBRC 1130 / NCYC 568 / NRRL Y-229) TaxID=559307 RepID=C5DRJ6_ZYGRC|nr:uncharacterized protein ZYRO0B08954g [Zygosaccharomyces rouxii]KAH9200057.1 Rof/RNase P-like protein [Zygosaccharomyces rouxii]CAR26407.1 ZYRO0B08954p [Zygosaccharomyces rouxii]